MRVDSQSGTKRLQTDQCLVMFTEGLPLRAAVYPRWPVGISEATNPTMPHPHGCRDHNANFICAPRSKLPKETQSFHELGCSKQPPQGNIEDQEPSDLNLIGLFPYAIHSVAQRPDLPRGAIVLPTYVRQMQ